MDHIAAMTSQIATASEQQSAVAEEINSNINTINMMTRDTSTAVERISGSSEELSTLATQLEDITSHFRV
ncbi:hypothetical protein KDD30_01785 [Photobacterium sp. GJ3]|uniref:hypothetical protein n=1 Tax=Photobacterium sp. GJ3 TaxID=2829502 RepID=UPI001B8BCED0|nr:hypothetical protein [Photobacterium sp. GJ3]QUJ67917.1 hypothetical protein KDD30_01785 [Photobacterium sp. GJ3]